MRARRKFPTIEIVRRTGPLGSVGAGTLSRDLGKPRGRGRRRTCDGIGHVFTVTGRGKAALLFVCHFACKFRSVMSALPVTYRKDE